MSQWRIYLTFCQEFDLVPLPASMETILLYLAYLAESRSYVTIINYLSAVWTLHKMNAVQHLDPSSFPIVATLRGIRRTLGDVKNQARPVSVKELKNIFSTLDMCNSEDVAFWLAVILCFSGLLCKSNVVEVGLAIRLQDIELTQWGVLVRVVRTKTICYRERQLVIPFCSLPHSIFCVSRMYRLLSLLVKFPSPSSQLISYMLGTKWVRGTYSWFMRRLSGVSGELGQVRISTHSLRWGGASALGDAGFSLLEIKDMGDWSSLAVLQYITKTLQSRIDLDRRMCESLFDTAL